MTPTTRTLNLLRSSGYVCAVAERWIPKINRRTDLWHFGDVLAVHSGRRDFLIVQCTSLGNVSARLSKARAQGELQAWLQAGGRFEVHGWNGRKVKIITLRPEDMTAVILAKPARKPRGQWQPSELFV
jgi:hypothetical protein